MKVQFLSKIIDLKKRKKKKKRLILKRGMSGAYPPSHEHYLKIDDVYCLAILAR